ncbi:Vacuolar protein sorting-associated protein 52 A [Cladophialophora carrionii]|uniref:Vacuolar protein sorting-associated protein 52 A n=1 Tax=Cladophialophora carrionii TaxID=86049 RepID=A0A1C1D0A4_9EURO|nr:Vacuolar protein sorting-associated protein 52 A [Cladophialophora carrionii]
MWLDRLTAGAATPGASREPLTPSRPYSPAPRKNSQLAPSQRTLSGLGLSANRSSTSLDLSANTSTASLTSPPRQTNGSALRFEQRPPPDVPDPVHVLRELLGKPGAEEGQDATPKFQDGRLAKDIDFGALSLQEFANREIPYGPATTGYTLQPSARENRQKYQDFHNSVLECDQVLRNVETYLTNFKAELGQVSAEIEELQARSIQLNAKLDNRRNVEKLLGPAVEEVSLSPLTVRSIAEGAIDETFVKAINEVEARSLIMDAKEKNSEQVKALQDLKPLLEDLKVKALERIRDYIVAQIKALRSPNINAQVIQQQTFLRYKDLYAFLARNHPVLAEEIGQAYVNTMRWYYSSHFSRYQQALSSLQIHAFDLHDLLGSDPALARRNVLGTSKPAPHQHDAFNLGRREEIIKSKTDTTAIPAYLAEDSKSAHYLEIPFRNFNRALIDNVSAEYSVVTELFATNTYHQISRRVTEIFEATFTTGHNLTRSLVENTNDCLGLLLCVRLNQHFAFEAQRRKVPVADSYINYTNILLWPRFQMVMDAHCESLRKVSIPSSGPRGAAAAFSLVGGGSSDTSRASVAPHAITQRFGQLLQGILLLSAEAGDDEPVSNSLARLRTEYETLMGKLAKAAGDASKRAKFLYNNYSLVLTIISDTRGKLAGDQKEHFGTLVRELKGR